MLQWYYKYTWTIEKKTDKQKPWEGYAELHSRIAVSNTTANKTKIKTNKQKQNPYKMILTNHKILFPNYKIR
jgi:hypothetical protein